MIDRCVKLGLRKPEFRQDEDFMVTLWEEVLLGLVPSWVEKGTGLPDLLFAKSQQLTEEKIKRCRVGLKKVPSCFRKRYGMWWRYWHCAAVLFLSVS